MKKTAEKILKNIGLFDKIQTMRNKRKHRKLLRMEAKMNLDMLSTDNAKRIEHLLRIKIHHLEKMLAIGELTETVNNKSCFGILTDIEKLLKCGRGFEDNAIIEGLSILNCYIGICEKSGMDCSEVKSQAERLLHGFDAGINISEYPAIEIVTAAVKEKPSSPKIPIDVYIEHISNRVSIRESKPAQIERDTIRNVIDLANRCPSAANRQPCKVYFSVDITMQEKLKALCGDKQVSSRMHNFMVPTVDKTMFSRGEPFQAWLNGGIFVDSLVSSLHTHNLGSCIFQMMKNSKSSIKVKSLLGIPEYEDILCVIGYGEYPDNVRHIKKHRKPVDAMAIER